MAIVSVLHSMNIRDCDMATAPRPLVEGILLKQGAHTGQLHQRYVTVGTDRQLRYWTSASSKSAGDPHRGGGTVVQAEEWWPRRGALHVAVALKKARAVVANDEQFDGRTFLVRLAGKTPAAYYMVAASPAQRRQWLTALVEPAVTTSLGPPVATGESLEETSNGSDGATAPCATDGTTHSTGTAAEADSVLAEVLQSLPDVWDLWHVQGGDKEARSLAIDQYATLLRKAPSCWQLLQDR